MTDEARATESTTANHTPLREPPLAWPPPGLERIQGDAGHLAFLLLTGGVVFTMPLLASTTATQDLWSLGIFGEAWWILMITSLVGGVTLLAAYVGLFRLFRRTAWATKRGYAASTVRLVAADRGRDSGFLLQGRGAYSVLGAERRGGLVTRRVWEARLKLLASAWLSSGFVVGVLLSGPAGLDEGGLVALTIYPPLLLGLIAQALRLWDGFVVGRARRQWHRTSWTEDLARDEIGGWHEAMAGRDGALPVVAGEGGAAILHRVYAAGALLAAAAVVLVGVPLVGAASIGPVITLIAVPSYSNVLAGAAEVEAAQPWRATTRPEVTPAMAGEALASLAAAGQPAGSVQELMVPPARTYGTPLFEEGEKQENPTGIESNRWATELMPSLAEGVDPATLDYLRSKAEHPALEELRILSGATLIDYSGTLWVSRLPTDLTPWEIPLMRFSGLREAAHATVAAATVSVADGDVEAAEARLVELVSAGSLLAKEDPTLIGNLLGTVMVKEGADALEALYRVTGQAEAAETLFRAREAARAAAAVAKAGGLRTAFSSFLSLPDPATDSDAVRGLRWERFFFQNAIGPCFNLNRAVFGPPDDFEAWTESAREALVRTEAEAQLFDAALTGTVLSDEASDSWLNGILNLVLGSEHGPRGCAAAMLHMND